MLEPSLYRRRHTVPYSTSRVELDYLVFVFFCVKTLSMCKKYVVIILSVYLMNKDA